MDDEKETVRREHRCHVVLAAKASAHLRVLFLTIGIPILSFGYARYVFARI